MKSSCIVKAHQAGLFSNLNNVIACKKKYDYVSVDWTESIYGEADLWPVLFQRPSGIIPPFAILPEAEAPKIVQGYEDQWLTYKYAGALYLSDGSWRDELHQLWKLLSVQPEITANVARFPMLNQFRGKTVAALIRANTHAGEQMSGKSQTLEQYVQAIEAENPDHVYIACQDLESIVWLRDYYGGIEPRQFHIHRFARRSPSRDIDRHLVEPQTFRDAIVVLEEALIMSQCDVLVHPVSNISTAVLYMNPRIKSVFLQ